MPQGSPGPWWNPGRLLPSHLSLLPSTSSRMWATPCPHSLRSSLPRGQKHPGLHPAEESPARNTSSLETQRKPSMGISYPHWCLRKPWDALPPTTASPWTCASNALCSLSAAKSWWWGLPHHPHPPPAHHPTPGMLCPQRSRTAHCRAGDADF